MKNGDVIDTLKLLKAPNSFAVPLESGEGGYTYLTV
jgi:hypothetical protein